MLCFSVLLMKRLLISVCLIFLSSLRNIFRAEDIGL